MIKTTRRLAVRRETLRTLDARTLTVAVGGTLLPPPRIKLGWAGIGAESFAE